LSSIVLSSVFVFSSALWQTAGRVPNARNLRNRRQ
jgi:hypothetical protein